MTVILDSSSADVDIAARAALARDISRGWKGSGGFSPFSSTSTDGVPHWIVNALSDPNTAIAYSLCSDDGHGITVTMLVPYGAYPRQRTPKRVDGALIVFLCGQNDNCGTRALNESILLLFAEAKRRGMRKVNAVLSMEDSWRADILATKGFVEARRIFSPGVAGLNMVHAVEI